MKFNGAIVEEHFERLEMVTPFRMQQLHYASKVTELAQPSTAEDFASLRGKIAYIATSTFLNLLYYAARLAQCKPENADKNAQRLACEACTLLQTPSALLNRQLDIESLRINSYADASFASNAELSSQLGMFVFLKNYNGHAAIIHYGSCNADASPDRCLQQKSTLLKPS